MAVDAPPRTLGELAALLGGRIHGVAADTPLTGLCVDSREARPGEAFFALRGSRSSGALHARDALARNAALVVCDAPIEGVGPWLEVPSAQAALIVAADAWYGAPQRDLDLVGVTGTKGKTTTAQVAGGALGALGRKAAVFGTVAHDVGAGEPEPSHNTTPGPLELRRLLARARENGCGTAVLEVSSHALHQQRTRGLRFAVGVFTNLAHDHLDYHGDPDAYFEAKALLFTGLDEDATAVLNRGDACFQRLVERCAGPVLTFGEGPGVDLGFSDLVLGIGGTEFRLLVRGEDQGVLRTRLVGRHNVLNVLAAVGALAALGQDPVLAARAACAVAAVRGRLERVAGAQDLDAFVDYAHTEDALRAVLSFLRDVGAAPVVCVVGCGGDRDRTKRPRMARAAAELSERVVLTSDNPRSEDPLAILREMLGGLDAAQRARAEVVPDRREAIRRAVLEAPAGATVLVAGKGHEATQVMGDTTLPFDDVLEVRAALHERSGRFREPPAGRGPFPGS